MDITQTAPDPSSRRPHGPSRRTSGAHASTGSLPSSFATSLYGFHLLFALVSSLISSFAVSAGIEANPAPTQLDLTRERAEARNGQDEIWHLQRTTLNQLATSSTDVRIRIPIPKLAPVTASMTRRTLNPDDRSTWAGVIDGIPGSQIILGVNGKATAGSVLIPGKGSFSLVPTSDAKLRIVANSSGTPLPCGTTATPPISTPSAVSPTGLQRFRHATRLQDLPIPPDSIPSNGPVQLDLLVAYTSAALNGAGGLPGLTAQIDAAIEEANISFQNSRVPITLRLSQAVPVSYAETGQPDRDLAQLTHAMEEAYEQEEYPRLPEQPGEEGEDEEEEYGLGGVISARRATRSDLVCLLVESGDDTAGVANQLWEAKPDFAPRALSVIQRGFFNRFQILAHEIGHNLGCQHERAATPSNGVFPYSHGFRLTVDGFNYRTIMATLPGITLPNFSNPEVTFLGRATGVPASEPEGADNARSLLATASIAARFSDFWAEGPEPMVVTLASPEPGSGFALNEYAEFEVRTPAGMVVKQVDFYVNDLWVGTSTQSPYRFPWTSAKAGKFLVTARATTPIGQTQPCAPVPIQFSMPPSIALKAPGLQGRGWVDQTMECRVEAQDPDGTIARVEYYADDYRIGVSETPPFALTWEPKWAQSYVLTARAIDNTGVSRTSNGIPIQVLPSMPSFELGNTKAAGLGIQIPFSGSPGTQCRLETSVDLQNWTTLRIVTLGQTSEWTPASESGAGARFYRLTPIP